MSGPTNVDRCERARIGLDAYIQVHDRGTMEDRCEDDAVSVMTDILTDFGHWHQQQFGKKPDFGRIARLSDMNYEAETDE